MEMATVWVALATETAVLLAAAVAAVAWVRRSPANTTDQELAEAGSQTV
jgi:hypothetical protein